LAPALCRRKMGNCHKQRENRQALVLNRRLHTNNVVLFCHWSLEVCLCKKQHLYCWDCDKSSLGRFVPLTVNQLSVSL